MKLRIPSPRLLPLTIFVLAALLACKSVMLVRAASPSPGRDGALAAAGSAVVPAALASTRDPAPHPAPTPEAPPHRGAAQPKPPAAPPVSDAETPPAVNDSERALLLDLRERRQELETREAALATRESVLSAAEQRLTARVEELQSLQTRLEALETARRDRDEANWRGLVKLYENMKPREAAAIFNDLDMAVLLQVLDRMKEAKAALVLAAMQAEKARQVTAELAQMRTRANTPASGG